MPNYSSKSIVPLLLIVRPSGMMDEIEMAEVMIGSMSNGCWMCIPTARFNSKEGGGSKASRFFQSRTLHITQQTLVVAVVGAGAHFQRCQSLLLMMLQTSH